MSPKVSIVIPTFNRAHFLRTAIDSALAQTYKCEVIVCDHGSTDNTPEIVKEYGDLIKYIRKENDFGVHFCWLDGIMNATGEYIHINYDDDWISPWFIEETIKLMVTEVAFVFTAVTIVHEQDKKKVSLYKNLFQTGLYRKGKIENILMRSGSVISPGCAIYRKKDLIDNIFVGGIPGAIYHYKGVGPDLLFSLLPLLKYKKFGFINKELVFFRAHSNSITQNAASDKKTMRDIKKAYNDAKVFYLKIKLVKNNIIYPYFFINHFRILMIRSIEKIINYLWKANDKFKN